ncbi:MAG: penicillin-binding protein 2 [Brevinematales bacterium]|nr:penicillin-binding protein 2 [Brevinematales bacterium]
MNKERFGVFFFFFLLFFFFIEARIIILSLFPDEKFIQNIVNNRQRGKILDRNGVELAISKDFFSIYVRPKRLSEEKKYAIYNELSKTKIFSEYDLKNIFSEKEFVWLIRKGDRDKLKYVKEWIDKLKEKKILKNDELDVIIEKGRFYPYQELALLIGNVSIDNDGIAGIENSYNEFMSSGSNIQLTVDKELSTICYQELEKAIVGNLAESGSVIVIENRTMEILAMVSYPSYDPNQKVSGPHYFYFPATSYIFEPGSIMKVFSMAYAIDRGLASKGTPLLYCPGEVLVNEVSFRCFAPHGYVSPETIIQKSCNVGMIQLADKFRRDEFYNYLLNLGFGKEPALKLYGLEKGILREPTKWSVLSKYMISIGQEIGVTALQLAISSTIIARNGEYKNPVLIRNSFYDNVNNQIIKPQTANNLLEMMKKVIGEEGTALSARIEGISIAGKTGTGQIANPKGGYYKDLYNAVFVGFLPAENPRYTILVVIHKPKAGKNTGGAVAAPVFANIVRRMIINGIYIE